MLRFVVVGAAAMLAAAIAIAAMPFGADSKHTACVAEVERLERAYQAHMPSGRPHSIVENGISAARRYCNEGNIKDAHRATNTAGMLCRLNNGCGKS